MLRTIFPSALSEDISAILLYLALLLCCLLFDFNNYQHSVKNDAKQSKAKLSPFNSLYYINADIVLMGLVKRNVDSNAYLFTNAVCHASGNLLLV